jgi:bifunctional non-homologous end joining protein LigD
VFLYAFDLIELNGDDLRREPIEARKAMLTQLVREPLPGLVLNATFEEPGDVVFKHACALGCEGIMSKRLGSRYRSGRTKDWFMRKLGIFDPDRGRMGEGGLMHGCSL